MLDHLLASYAKLKLSLGREVGFGEYLLHVHAGLLIFFVTAIVFKRRMRSKIPIAIVFAFAIINEIVDLYSTVNDHNAFESLIDILNTVLWPTLLFILARRRAKAENCDRVD